MAIILPFTRQNRRPRRSKFIGAPTILPPGVVKFRPRKPEPIDVMYRSPELLLSLLILGTADEATKRCVRHNILSLAQAGDEDAIILKPLAEAL